MGYKTYLLGAGASANCLPTYKNFKDRFIKFYDFLQKCKKVISQDEEHLLITKEIIDAVRKVNEELKFHNTPDTIAKKYFHQSSHDDLIRLKRILIIYFFYEQFYVNGRYSITEEKTDIIDLRYDSLIAALLKPKKGLSISSDYRILTWNYDMQFELSFSNYMQNNFISECQDKIQSFPKALKEQENNFQKEQFSILHLNGIAYAKRNYGNQPDCWGNYKLSDDHLFRYIVDTYYCMKKNSTEDIGGERLLTFAWENIDENYKLVERGIYKYAKQICSDTEILIINGYSFPIFNRTIDKYLFENMKNLREIFIQSPQFDQIKATLENELLDTNAAINNVGYWNSFYIN